MSFQLSDLDPLINMVQSLAKRELMPRFLDASLVRRRKTSAFDIVTQADEAMETALTQALAARFPHAQILGEEACTLAPHLLQAMHEHPLLFVVDPLDGTKNFADGLPLFGVMLSVLQHGKTVAGLIHDPITGVTCYGMHGHGAWLLRSGSAAQRLQVKTPAPIGAMDCIIGTMFLPQPQRDEVSARLSRVGTSTWFRCAAHEYRLLASGACDAIFYNKLMPWDHAAGVLIHQEAGGYSAFLDGSPYTPTRHSGGLICAPDERSWRALKAALFFD